MKKKLPIIFVIISVIAIAGMVAIHAFKKPATAETPEPPADFNTWSLSLSTDVDTFRMGRYDGSFRQLRSEIQFLVDFAEDEGSPDEIYEANSLMARLYTENGYQLRAMNDILIPMLSKRISDIHQRALLSDIIMISMDFGINDLAIRYINSLLALPDEVFQGSADSETLKDFYREVLQELEAQQ